MSKLTIKTTWENILFALRQSLFMLSWEEREKATQALETLDDIFGNEKEEKK